MVYTQRKDAKAVKSRCILFRVQKGLEVMPLIVIGLEVLNIIVKGHKYRTKDEGCTK